MHFKMCFNKNQLFEVGLPPGYAGYAVTTSQVAMLHLKYVLHAWKITSFPGKILKGAYHSWCTFFTLQWHWHWHSELRKWKRHCSFVFTHSLDSLLTAARQKLFPLKHYLHEASQTWMMSNEQRKITRLQFGQLATKLRGASTTTGDGV
jgi:hypothetical protein